MNQSPSTRRAFTLGLATLPLGLVAHARAADDAMAANPPADGEGISQRAAAIHQEVLFAAAPERIYRTLTRADLFDRVVRASAAAAAVLKPGAPPTRIQPVAGTPFQLFGGYLSGRQIELVSNQRIVQAWRMSDWEDGVYSIVRFELAKSKNGTRLVLDHTGIPDSERAGCSGVRQRTLAARTIASACRRSGPGRRNTPRAEIRRRIDKVMVQRIGASISSACPFRSSGTRPNRPSKEIAALPRKKPRTRSVSNAVSVCAFGQ